MPPQSTNVIDIRIAEYAFHRFKLHVVEGKDVGKTAVSDENDFVIGTAVGNQFVLTDGTVSRHHCSLTAEKSRGLLVRDLDSTNGTFLGEHRVQAAYIKTAGVIRVGRTTLRVEAIGEEIRVPLSQEDRFGAALGCSAAMRRIFASLPRIAASDSAVLLMGETGTGKGMLAEAIHAASARRAGPFVVVDCASISPSLIESELFGHERGSFTGAHASRPGAFEAAGGGTIFLDEIGELPLDMQPKLLRVLEDREIRRVGGVEKVRLDARIVAATNRDLRREVNHGSFRSDLLYRLNTLPIYIPPLRERREDIALLVGHFYAQLTGGASPPTELAQSFAQRDWPGNVRELKGAVERAVMFDGGDGALVSSVPPPSHVPHAEIDPAVPFRVAKEQALAKWERVYLAELLAHHRGNVSAAARTAQMDRNYLRELIRRHGIGRSWA